MRSITRKYRVDIQRQKIHASNRLCGVGGVRRSKIDRRRDEKACSERFKQRKFGDTGFKISNESIYEIFQHFV